jgi:formylglycine-generating enzyme required for sulfatase activity
MKHQQISHYRLTDHLGAGSYGEVWKGVHVDDPAFVVAVKLVSPQMQREPGFIEALRRECRILDGLDHPGIVRFRELVVREGQVAMVLELLEGEDLEGSLGRGPQPVAEVARILELALEGLAYAHARGLVHRDIKPANVYRCRDGRVKLMDFGLSRAAGGSGGSSSGVVKGTLDYMAPERFSGGGAPVSDVYALGLVAWELLAGRRAAPAGDLPTKLGWHLMTGAGDVRGARPDCPAWLAELLLAMTAREAAARPADGGAALAELRRLRAAFGAPGRAPAPRPPPTVEVKVGGGGPAGARGAPAPPPTVEVKVGPAPAPAPPPAHPPSPAPPVPAPASAGGGAFALLGALGVLVVGVVVCAGTGGGGDATESTAQPEPAQAPAAEPSTSVDYPMVKVPVGTFTMGSPASEAGRDDDEQQHKVTLTRSYLMGKTEVTQALWQSVMGTRPTMKEYKGASLLGDQLPMYGVSWCEAVEFANRLSSREGLSAAYQGVDQCESSEGKSVVWDRTSAGYRLPTEAEWEFAARGGVGGPYAGGATAEEACAVGNVLTPSSRAKYGVPWDSFACEDGHLGPSPVGSYRANGYGLHDLTGNVWEWCWDWYGPYGGASTDPVGAQSGPFRVYRGGSWLFGPRYARVANRYSDTPGTRNDPLGFRLVRTIP